MATLGRVRPRASAHSSDATRGPVMSRILVCREPVSMLGEEHTSSGTLTHNGARTRKTVFSGELLDMVSVVPLRRPPFKLARWPESPRADT